MTTTELKDKIAKAADFEWFKSMKITISFPYINYSQEFTGISSIYEYVIQQIEGWEKEGNDLPEELKRCKNYFLTIKSQIIHFVSSYINDSGNSLKSYGQTVQ